jgi:hypothetical protein
MYPDKRRAKLKKLLELKPHLYENNCKKKKENFTLKTILARKSLSVTDIEFSKIKSNDELPITEEAEINYS